MSDYPRTASYFHPLRDEPLNEFRMSKNHWLLAIASRNVKSDNNSIKHLQSECQDEANADPSESPKQSPFKCPPEKD